MSPPASRAGRAATPRSHLASEPCRLLPCAAFLGPPSDADREPRGCHLWAEPLSPLTTRSKPQRQRQKRSLLNSRYPAGRSGTEEGTVIRHRPQRIAPWTVSQSVVHLVTR